VTVKEKENTDLRVLIRNNDLRVIYSTFSHATINDSFIGHNHEGLYYVEIHTTTLQRGDPLCRFVYEF